jgi:uncharacterized protein with beta-barrel porin domain
MGGRGRAGLLLSSSVAALLIGAGAPAAFAACTVDQTGGTVASVSNASPAANCINVLNATVTGNVVNTSAGVLTANGGSPPSNTGITINNSSVGGAVSNAGTINANNIGILVGGAMFAPNFFSPTVILASPATVSGGITNTGTIAAGSAGIWVQAADTFGGGIVNAAAGTIFGQVGIAVGVGATTFGVRSVSSFGGGIVNQGLIQVSGAGIFVNGVSTFDGGIRNSGTLLNIGSGGAGISVDSVDRFSGGIVNAASGTISGFGAGIVVCGCVTTFLDGIANAGLIAANSVGISVGGVSVFGGGISNSGTISVVGFGPNSTGIAVTGVATFANGITNTGLISAAGGFVTGGVGILVEGVKEFSGNIENGSTGSITANGNFFAFATPTAVGIQVSGVRTFTGDIINRGQITVTSGTGIGVFGVKTFNGNVVNAGTIVSVTAAAGTGAGIAISGVLTFGGHVVNTGTIMAITRGIVVDGVGSFGGGITNGGLIALTQPGSSAGITIDNVSLFSGKIYNYGTITGGGFGIQIGSCSCGVETFAGGITNAGLIAANGVGIFIDQFTTTFGGGITNTGTISASNAGIVVNGASFVGGNIVNTGTIMATVAIDVSTALNSVTIEQNAGLIAGDILLSSHGDTLFVRGGTINGNILGQNAGDTINFALGAGTFTYAAGYNFSQVSQVNVQSGVVVLNDPNNQAGTVTIAGGVLQVGDSNSPNAGLTITGVGGLVDVTGGTLSGHGTVTGNVTIENGGVLFPGGSIGTLTVASGDLTFQPGSSYLVQIAPGANNNSATAMAGGGVAINGGTLFVLPQLGHYGATSYTIVSGASNVTGTFTSSAFAAPFTYTGTIAVDYTSIPGDVLLTLTDGFALLAPIGTNQNQQAVVNGINAFIVGTGASPPPQFANLANLPGPALLNALNQLSGENHAGFLQGAFQAGNSFLTLLVNPFLDGRFGPGGGFAAAMGFAAEEPPALPEAALAFAKAMPVKAPPLGIATSAPAAYRAWGSAYGGAETVDGDPVVGSHRTTSRAFGFAAGVDYPIAPMTTLGFALAGGGTNWGLDGGLGGGHSDMFQAGAYGSHRWGAAYLSAALAYNFHDVTTDRTVTLAGVDRLTAGFQAHGLGARVEGGWRYATPWLGVTPYGAVQVQSIFLPGYGETATAGSNQFALNFASQTATATRTELGAWLDKSTLLANGALVTLYGRAAWAHDFGNTRAVSAIFQALPGANFVVNGAAPAPDSALVTAGALYRLASGWSFQAKFDGEFSSTTNVYSGTGVVKKVW